MNKKLPCLYILVLVHSFLFGQITVTNSIFPQTGDLLFTAVDSATPGALITPPSDNAQNWDFSNFLPASVDTTFVLDASQGQVFDQFPDADIIFPLFNGEGYFRNSGDSLVLLGFFGDAGFGVSLVVQASDPQVQYAAPINFGTTFQDDFAFTRAIDPEDFPELAALLPPFPPIDSVRAVYFTHREDTVDAFGTMETYLGNFEVLRQKRVEYINLLIEFKAFNIWVDPATLGFPIPIGGLDTTTTYQFINDQSKEIIASVEADSADIITSIVYKADPTLLTSIAEFPDLGDAIRIFPNPLKDQVFIEWYSEEGNYQVRFIDQNGRLIQRRQQFLIPGNTYEFSLVNQAPGLILVQVIDQKGKILHTGKLLKN